MLNGSIRIKNQSDKYQFCNPLDYSDQKVADIFKHIFIIYLKHLTDKNTIESVKYKMCHYFQTAVATKTKTKKPAKKR